MFRFIEVDIANTDSKTLVNVAQIVNVGKHYNTGNGYISFNTASCHDENYIQTKQSYEELKKMIFMIGD